MPEEFKDPWCLTLPMEYADERDFKADEAIKLDFSIELPDSFSLGKWIYKTNYQWAYGSCTANSTCHWVQILNVRKGGIVPSNKNIITPSWKDLWKKMWHDLSNLNDSGDYVEKAISTALKEWIYIEEDGEIARFDGYATQDWWMDDESIEKMKRYLYKGCPIIWVMRWDNDTWKELTLWELKTKPKVAKQWHAIALVGWDKRWMRFVNSWKTNDGLGLKSRFFVSYDKLKDMWGTFNYRYWVLYNKEDENKTAEYLKQKNRALVVLKALRKLYDWETKPIKNDIVKISIALREEYPELNYEYPVE